MSILEAERSSERGAGGSTPPTTQILIFLSGCPDGEKLQGDGALDADAS
jgi:hypothetical protein